MSDTTTRNRAPLLEQQLALGAYLEALLRPATAPQAAPAQPETPPPEAVPQAASDSVQDARAQERFQALLFRVAGLTLAVPLEELNGVIPWPEALIPMPGHAPHFLGLHSHLGNNVQVVDIAAVVLPPELGSRAAPAAERCRHIVLVDGGRWGLACDEVDEVIELRRDEVKWRSPEGRRPWLAGTVVQQMCALLDVPAFVRLLQGDGGEG